MKTLVMLALLWTFPAFADATCPAAALRVLRPARQLIVVQTPTWNSVPATLQFFERVGADDDYSWKPLAPPIASVVGRNGQAWGHLYADLARGGEPLKHEGDGRTPAGVHALGLSFGFSLEPRENYIPLNASTVCVDDPASRFYSQIVDASTVKKDWKSAEQMRNVENYRAGFNIQYITDAASRTGSCIFFHIWNNSNTGTAGCVAIEGDAMTKAQSWVNANAHPAIAFIPASATERFSACLPIGKRAVSARDE